MKQNKIEKKAYYNDREVKIIELQNIPYFFFGLQVLDSKWGIKHFVEIKKIKDENLKDYVYKVLIGLIYKRMCCKRGWEVNFKRFKNQMLYKTKAAFIFSIQGELQEIQDEDCFDKAVDFLKKIKLIKTGSHHSYIELYGPTDYCQKLGNYLFNTWYCQESFKRNSHYFGDHSSGEHERAYEERLKKPKHNELLN